MPLNEKNDPEMSYRRGYRDRALEMLRAVEADHPTRTMIRLVRAGVEVVWTDGLTAHFAKRYEALSTFIPQRETHTTKALRHRQPAYAAQFRMLAQRPRQVVERNSAAQMMHMMHANVRCEPA